MNTTAFFRVSLGAALAAVLMTAELPAALPAKHTFAIGDKDFLLDGKPLQIRCGEIHFARVPREYWRNRLQSIKAMGLNAVCAYLFWNYHEFEKGRYDWAGQADAAEFCRIAQEEGLWVVLRPGPYACAEWDGGGIPWWLLKNPNIKLRTRDPEFVAASAAWLKEVGRVLSPLQVTHGGPILMVQAENEYGSYGKDAEYMGLIRKALIDGGFNVPLFACNPGGAIRNGLRKDLFQVVNFGRDPQAAFRKLREVQPKGPLMCGEFYPGWFDTWGAPHHLGDMPRYLGDLDYMLKTGASFSIYMAHGGTSFGLWSGADRPFKPDTSSYDYDAPISEAGWVGEKFQLTRDLIKKYLPAGETLPEPPAALPVTTVPEFAFTEVAPVFANLPRPVADKEPRNMEAYDQGHGVILYRATLPAGPAAKLSVDRANDFAWVFVDGKAAGVMDRRELRYDVSIPARTKPAQLDILVEAMGHVNFGPEIHDRKGLAGPVELRVAGGAPVVVKGPWQVFNLRLDAPELAALKWQKADAAKTKVPAFWRGSFDLAKPADTFLDLRKWGKGVVWVNGHCLARYWNIGPTQTAFLPGAWLRAGRNEVVILDLLGPEKPVAAGLEKPILDELRPELDMSAPAGKGTLKLSGLQPVHTAAFAPGHEVQDIHFAKPATGRQFAIEALDSQDGKPFAAIAELDLLGADGQPISHVKWSIAYVDSEERVKEDGSASNAIDGQTANYWHTAYSQSQPPYPHRLIIDLGEKTVIAGFRYVPRAGDNDPGRIRNYRIFVGDKLVEKATD
jgi:beta-galactosidase